MSLSLFFYVESWLSSIIIGSLINTNVKRKKSFNKTNTTQQSLKVINNFIRQCIVEE